MLLILHIPFIKFPDKREPGFFKVVTNEYDINNSLKDTDNKILRILFTRDNN